IIHEHFEFSLAVGGKHSFFDVCKLGAKGNGVDDDRPFIQYAFNLAAAAGRGEVYFAPGRTYRVSKYVDVAHASGLHIVGRGAVIRYPSDRDFGLRGMRRLCEAGAARTIRSGA
ncbi:MAG TPA: glycosyl hydrolase family 28-related protein, partial [Kofleriaceae bacterium]|nr:glycosyl hydrolase family 28-related protein [Kofleriaceae bacterium]